jgi:hypothetical protein
MTCVWFVEVSMTTICTLKKQGVRFTYQPTVKTFFWVDDKFYTENKQEILEWAARYKCNVPSTLYGWVTCPDDDVALLFRIRWS